MADLMIAKRHLNALATTLDAMGNLTPPPTSKGRWLVVKALPKIADKAQKSAEELKKWLDMVVTKDDNGKPMYREQNGIVQFDFVDPADADHFVEIQAETVTIEGVRQMTRAELGECPITVAQEFFLVQCGFLEDNEPA